MRPPRLDATFIATGLLAGAWSAVAFAAGSLLPTSAPAARSDATSSVLQANTVFPLRVDRPHPCTGDPVILDVTLSILTTAHLEGDGARVYAEASLDNAPVLGRRARVVPVVDRFGFYAALFGKPIPLREIHAPLADPSEKAELVVALQQGVDDAGQLSIKPTAVRLACTERTTDVSWAGAARQVESSGPDSEGEPSD